MSIIIGLLLLAVAAFAETSIINGTMEGTPVDHSNGKGLLVTPPGWTPVNVNADNGDRLSVEQSDRPDGGQCLHVQTSGGGAYQTVTPLEKDTTYLVSAWVKRISGTINLDAYSHNWGPPVMRILDDHSTGWTQITTQLNTIDDGAHIYLIGNPKGDYLIDDVQIRRAPMQVSKPEFNLYDFSSNWKYKATITPVAGQTIPDKVKIQAVTPLGKVLGTPRIIRMDSSNPVTFTISLPLKTMETFCVEVRDPVNGQLLCGSISVLTAGSPWIVRYPFKNSLYSSLKYRWDLKINVLTLKADSLVKLQTNTAIIDSKGKVVRKAVGKISGDSIAVPLDAKGLKPGDYRLQLVVRKKDGKSVYEATQPLHVMPAAKNEVIVNSDGDTMINGKRFFPIGLYWVMADPTGWKPGPARKTADMLELRDAGFNTLHTYAFEHNDANDTDENALAYLDMAQELGFKVMMGLTRAWCQGNEINTKAIVERVNKLKNHPALLCWTLWDEPDGNLANVPKVQAVYDIVNREDPYHPAMPVFMQGGGRPFRNATDINLLDYYPGAGNAKLVPGVLAQAKIAIPDKPIWYAAQAYNHPSEEDMRLFWKYALEADAKAIFWYSYGGDGKDWDSIRNTPELFTSVKRAVKALADEVEKR